MKITNKLQIDLATRGISPRISAVQNDANTRELEITLTAGGESWQVPTGVTAAVAYRKPDGTRGLYDTLPDGTKAVSISGNVVTAVLAPQALTVAGDISAAVILHDKDLNQLATFPFMIIAAPNPAAGAASDNYYAYSTMEDVSDAVEAWLAETEAEKEAFLSEAEDALSTIRQIVTEAEDAPAIVCQASGEMICIDDASDRLVRGLTLYGKTTQNGTPTIDAPIDLVSVGDSGNLEVEILGKNFIKPVATETSIEKNGVTATFRTDGSIVLNGTNTSGAFTMLFMYSRWSSPVAIKEFLKLRAGTYTLSVTSNDTISGWSFRLQTHPYTTKYDYVVSAQNNKRTFVAETDLDVILFVGVSADATFNNVIIRPQIELGSVATEYEPYKEQTLTIPTPNGLAGIPVSSGGNYTDSNGQQWVCDERDLARGVNVQRVQKYEFNGLESVGAPYGNGTGFFYKIGKFNYPIPKKSSNLIGIACNYLTTASAYSSGTSESMLYFRDIGSFATPEEARAWLKDKYNSGTPFTVVYAIDEPIETPLTESVMAAYASLHTNKPNTTVQTDSNAGVALSYIADTKTYIDNKFTELQNAILTTGANV